MKVEDNSDALPVVVGKIVTCIERIQLAKTRFADLVNTFQTAEDHEAGESIAFGMAEELLIIEGLAKSLAKVSAELSEELINSVELTRAQIMAEREERISEFRAPSDPPPPDRSSN